MDENFKRSFSIVDGIFKKDESNSVTRYLLSNINDNVHQNLDSLSPLKYDPSKKFHKNVLTQKELYESIDENTSSLSHAELSKKIHRSVDKILLSHRNSAIFLILMSGPFLIGFQLFKYTLKILVFLFILKKNKKPAKKKEEKEEVKSENAVEQQTST